MSNIPKHRQLPDKENRLFKELLTQYEYKQYKKGLKAADTILKKFPNHGETIALKALTLHSSLPFPMTVAGLTKQEEAESLARLAVKKDITSHITWHVLGILAKTRKDWDEATRAFAMARKQDSENIPLMRDSIALYLHTRQFSQAVAARHQHLLLRPTLRSSWTSLIIAHHLNGDMTEGIEVYDQYLGIVKNDGATSSEKAQLLMHIITMCMEAGQWDDALRRLENGLKDGVLSTRGQVTQLKAEILMQLGRESESEDVWRALIEQNPDNLSYYDGFLRTKGYEIRKSVTLDSTSKIVSLLNSFAESYPKALAPRRMCLDIARGDEFRDLARAYLVNGLEKAIPSLFVDVKGLYVDLERMKIVGEIVEDLIQTLEKDAGLHDDDSKAPPTALLWAYYFLALHLAHPAHPNPSYDRSLQLLSTALKHTPTLPEIYMAEAMVRKRAGDILGAAKAMEEARLLDGQDRFLNCKAAKYWLRVGEVAKAEELTAMFTKKDIATSQDLTDLQCLWFLQEEGDSYRANGNLGMALKRYQSLATTFQDYEDDQYDFHTYCLRRMTFSAYYSLMKYEDQLRSHPAYFKASLAAINIYTRLHDDPSLKEEKLTAEEEAERKKAAKKAQKAEQKARKAAAATGEGKKEDQPVPDEDPQGSKLLKTETPLDEALKLWKPLELLASSRIETWTTGYQIYIRKKLYLAAFKCLLQAHDIDPRDPNLHWEIIHFKQTVSAVPDLAEPVKMTTDQLLPSLIPSDADLAAYNANLLSQHSSSPAHILGAAKGLSELDTTRPIPSSSLQAIESTLSRLAAHDVPPSVAIMSSALKLMKELGAPISSIDSLRDTYKSRVPLASVFESDEELKRRRREALEGEEVANGVKPDL
ncbi:NMDA receptor-regulated protein 1-domain-containing protein [Kockovaella imperatae]|uniref:NMDA receptor-regulated protein 1-domain-containing protein n=1 Tax=Kockovaella imperatae TaxID=4999 RepID=A0A1Y1UKK0_9TREE|nr:NMDA receptor-regulated protein 1-domain-containing protein [Kockovaella imperatae]ORX38583.1 NMDA receptor-regulated protein 1-domain-containing protein [Kockovaella imperatae]